MTACGIDIRGRSKKLFLNYRTTEQIRKYAVSLLEDCEVDDLDDGVDELKRYKSVSTGPTPVKTAAKDQSEAHRKALEVLTQAINEERSVCVMLPTKREVEDLAAFLRKREFRTLVIGPNDHDTADAQTIRIATMHRAKGLEFDEVILLLPHSEPQTNTDRTDPRRLQYVALTRARKKASLIHICP